MLIKNLAKVYSFYFSRDFEPSSLPTLPVDDSRYESSLPGVDTPDRPLHRRPEAHVGAGRGPQADVLQAGDQMAAAAPVGLHAVVPVPVLVEVVGGPGCQGTVGQAGGSHLLLTTGQTSHGFRAVSVSQDDPRLGGTLEVWF